MNELTIDSLLETVRGLRLNTPVIRGYVATSKTFRMLQEMELERQREMLRLYPDEKWRTQVIPDLQLQLIGIPIRVEDPPDPQPGEVVLDWNPTGRVSNPEVGSVPSSTPVDQGDISVGHP